MKKLMFAPIALMSLALALTGCQGISSQADAEKAAAIIGLGPTAAQNGGTSATAKTIAAIKTIDPKALSASITWTSPEGGSITFVSAAASEMPTTEQTYTDALTTKAKVTYTNLVVKDSDGISYTVSGTAYARLNLSLVSPYGITVILTSSNIKISSTKITDTCVVDYKISVTTSGYTCSGTVNGYSVTNTFTIS